MNNQLWLSAPLQLCDQTTPVIVKYHNISLLLVLISVFFTDNGVILLCFRITKQMDRNKREWKESEEIFRKSSKQKKKVIPQDEYIFYKNPATGHQTVKNLPFMYRHPHLVHGVLVTTALLVLFSKPIYDFYNHMTNPQPKPKGLVQMHPES